jgi:acetyltransferase-like isoleucine patch superfamily enzyme
VLAMVSLRAVVFNFLRFRKTARCSISIGRYTPHTAYIISAEKTDRVGIGNFCSIGYGAVIIANNGHNLTTGFEDYRVATYAMAVLSKEGFKPSYRLPEKNNFVQIGNDVLVGAYSVILPGVTVGNGAIIGAGSIVTHDIPPYAVVAGTPAKVLRYRYSEEKIAKLQKIAWWSWSDKKIAENMDYFYGKIDDFIDKFYLEVDRPKIAPP